jgi:hypothetical protein
LAVIEKYERIDSPLLQGLSGVARAAEVLLIF